MVLRRGIEAEMDIHVRGTQADVLFVHYIQYLLDVPRMVVLRRGIEAEMNMCARAPTSNIHGSQERLKAEYVVIGVNVCIC